MYRSYVKRLAARQEKMSGEKERTSSTAELPHYDPDTDMDASKGIALCRESLVQIPEDVGVPSVFIVMGASVTIFNLYLVNFSTFIYF